MPQLSDLDRDQCLTLLRARWFGRFAVQTDTGPTIVPVNYALHDDAVVARISPKSVLGRYADGATLAFEVDLVDDERWQGWSVVARGQGRVVPDPPSSDPRETPRAWADGDRTAEVQLTWSELTGRRVGNGWDLLAALSTRRVRS